MEKDVQDNVQELAIPIENDVEIIISQEDNQETIFWNYSQTCHRFLLFADSQQQIEWGQSGGDLESFFLKCIS